MKRQDHTVTLPIEDYEDLIKNYAGVDMQRVTGGPIYEAAINAIKNRYPDTNTSNVELYFVIKP